MADGDDPAPGMAEAQLHQAFWEALDGHDALTESSSGSGPLWHLNTRTGQTVSSRLVVHTVGCTAASTVIFPPAAARSFGRAAARSRRCLAQDWAGTDRRAYLDFCKGPDMLGAACRSMDTPDIGCAWKLHIIDLLPPLQSTRAVFSGKV